MHLLKQKTLLVITIALLAVSIPTAHPVLYAQSLDSSGSSKQDCWHSVREMLDTTANMDNAFWQMCPDASNNTDQTGGTGGVNVPPTTVTSPVDGTGQTGGAGDMNATPIKITPLTDNTDYTGGTGTVNNPPPTITSSTDNNNNNYTPLDVPPRSQPTDNSCGPTDLAMAASYLLGTNITTSEIISMTNMTPTGSELSDLEDTAEKIGLTVVADNLSITSDIKDFWTGSNDLNDMTDYVNSGYPVIVGVDLSPYTKGHALLVTGVTDDSVFVNNSAGSGSKQVYSKSDFMAMWSAKGSRYVVLGPPKI